MDGARTTTGRGTTESTRNNNRRCEHLGENLRPQHPVRQPAHPRYFTARTPTPRPTTATPTAATIPARTLLDAKSPAKSAPLGVHDVAERIDVHEDLHPTWCVLEWKHGSRQDQEREHQRLLNDPEHPILLPHSQSESVRERTESDAEHSQQDYPERGSRCIDVQSERKCDQNDQNRLRGKRNHLLARSPDQQGRASERSHQHSLVRSLLHLHQEVGPGHRRSEDRDHHQHTGNEPIPYAVTGTRNPFEQRPEQRQQDQRLDEAEDDADRVAQHRSQLTAHHDYAVSNDVAVHGTWGIECNCHGGFLFVEVLCRVSGSDRSGALAQTAAGEGEEDVVESRPGDVGSECAGTTGIGFTQQHR